MVAAGGSNEVRSDGHPLHAGGPGSRVGCGGVCHPRLGECGARIAGRRAGTPGGVRIVAPLRVVFHVHTDWNRAASIQRRPAPGSFTGTCLPARMVFVAPGPGLPEDAEGDVSCPVRVGGRTSHGVSCSCRPVRGGPLWLTRAADRQPTRRDPTGEWLLAIEVLLRNGLLLSWRRRIAFAWAC